MIGSGNGDNLLHDGLLVLVRLLLGTGVLAAAYQCIVSLLRTARRRSHSAGRVPRRHA